MTNIPKEAIEAAAKEIYRLRHGLKNTDQDLAEGAIRAALPHLQPASGERAAGDVRLPTISPSDVRTIIAGIRRFGLAPDGSDLRDLESAFARLAAAPAQPPVSEEELAEALDDACLDLHRRGLIRSVPSLAERAGLSKFIIARFGSRLGATK